MDNLPEELVECIAEYLSVEDVVSCSNVNASWRKAFDINRVWKRFLSYHPSYFANNMCKLESSNVVLLSRHEGCEKKITVLNELILQNNMLQSNFHIGQINLGSVYCDNVIDVIDNSGNHWLFISYTEGTFFEPHKLQVWKLNVDPVLHTSVNTPLGQVSRLLDSKMEMKGDRLIFIYQNSFLMYEFSYPLYKLKLKCFLQYDDLNLRPSRNLIETKALVFLDIYVVAFGLAHDPDFETISTSITNVWDEDETFKKYKKQLMNRFSFHRNHYPTTLCRPPVFHAVTNNSDKILLVVQSSCSGFDSKMFTVKVFDVKVLNYTNFDIVNTGDIMSFDICGKVVSLLYSKHEDNMATLKCFHADSSEQLLMVEFGSINVCFLTIPKSSGGELLVIKKNTVCLFNTTLKKEMRKFNVIGVDLDVTVITKNLMLVKYFRGKTVHHEVYNFRLGQRLYAVLPPSTYLADNCYTCSFFTGYRLPPKIIMYRDPLFSYSHENKNNKIYIVSFW